jgi:hemolysin activation/secretion protein
VRTTFLVAVLASLTLVSAQAAAQGPAGVVTPPSGTPIPDLEPPATRRVGPGTVLPPAPAPSADPALAETLPIRSVEVVGATAFPEARLLAVAGPLTGPAVPLLRVEEARVAILGLYREEGYVFTTVDAVIERGGQLRLVVTEAELVEVLLDGDIGPAGTQVLRFLNNLVWLRPVNIRALERWLLLAEDVPGVSLRTVLRPAGTVPGALSLVAQVGRRPVTGYLTADNRGYRLTGPEQALAAVQFNAFTEFGERTELALFYASGRTQLFGQASSEVYLGGSGLRLRVHAGTGDSTPAAPLRVLGYEGTTTIAGLALSYPVIRQRQQTLVAMTAFDIIESEIKLDGGVVGNQRLSRDSLRVFRLGGDWLVYDLLAGDERPAVNAMVLRLSQGIAGLGASGSGDPNLSRSGAKTDFTKLALELTRTQTLFSPWQGATVTLQGTLAGQWTNDVLPQAEKFYLGGARFGRGYYAGEVTGDRALAGSLELQLAMSWEASPLGESVLVDPMVYAFYDLGETWENRSQDPNRRISSFGIGTRLRLTRNAEFQLEGVRRFERQPGGAQTDRLKRDALFWRVLFWL